MTKYIASKLNTNIREIIHSALRLNIYVFRICFRAIFYYFPVFQAIKMNKFPSFC